MHIALCSEVRKDNDLFSYWILFYYDTRTITFKSVAQNTPFSSPMFLFSRREEKKPTSFRKNYTHEKSDAKQELGKRKHPPKPMGMTIPG